MASRPGDDETSLTSGRLKNMKATKVQQMWFQLSHQMRIGSYMSAKMASPSARDEPRDDLEQLSPD